MSKQRNLVGQRFGHLIVLESVGRQSKTSAHFYSKVRCDCGREYIIRDSSLVNGVKSCTHCSKPNQMHGMTNTRLFNIWQRMIGRCNCKTNKDFKDYGGRGIVICDEWKNNFLNFYKWSMENGYKDKLTLDRIDVNGNYEPSNCRWATSLEQANNKRTNVYLTYKGKTQSISQWSREIGIDVGTLGNRIRSHWSVEKALSTPVRRMT